MVSFPQVSPPKPCIRLSSPLYALHAPLISFFLDLITRTIFGDQYRSLSSSFCSFLYSPFTSSLLGPNNLFNILFSDTISLRSSLNVSDQVSHTYKTTGKIIVIFTVKTKKNIGLFFLAQTGSAYQSTKVGIEIMFDFGLLLPNVHVSLERWEMRATRVWEFYTFRKFLPWRKEQHQAWKTTAYVGVVLSVFRSSSQ